MKKKWAYEVAVKSDLQELSDIAVYMMNAGYQCLGGISMTAQTATEARAFAQAFIKEVEIDD